MKKAIVLSAVLALAAALGAQEPGTPNPYEGTSSPPPDDTIVTTTTPKPKPPAGQPLVQNQSAPQNQTVVQNPADTPSQRSDPSQPAYATARPATQPVAQPTSVDPALNYPDPDGGIVQVPVSRPARTSEPPLASRAESYDPDGDIVHPHPLGPNELGEGTTIRVRLMSRLSSASAERGESFRARVASDVLRDGQVMIPAGSEIDGRVAMASSGHFAGSGTMRLQPETLTLADGSRYRFSAQVTGTPGSHARVEGEGVIRPSSRMGRNAIELGGGAAAGATAGALLAGPGGALTGGVVGLGVITAHLLISHPQATLESGSVLLLTLNERLNLVRAEQSGN